MAVYTQVTATQVDILLRQVGLESLQAMVPIAAGIENTNYFLDTAQGRWVLTIFERIAAGRLPGYLQLMHHLASAGLPVPDPRPLAGTQQRALSIAGKPAAIVPCLPGADEPRPALAQCQAMGVMVARLQATALGLEPQWPNPRGAVWREATAAQIADKLSNADAALLADSLTIQQRLITDPRSAELPQGPIHGDLFRDNVLWEGERISGVIDFYFAGFDSWLYDLAVTLNDWCWDDATSQMNEPRTNALLNAYVSERAVQGFAFTAAEQQLLPAMRQIAALRFWLSRLADWHQPRPAQVLKAKDPDELARILRACANAARSN